jgi:hypothetical protein
MPLSFFQITNSENCLNPIAAVPGRHLGPLSLKANPPSRSCFETGS